MAALKRKNPGGLWLSGVCLRLLNDENQPPEPVVMCVFECPCTLWHKASAEIDTTSCIRETDGMQPYCCGTAPEQAFSQRLRNSVLIRICISFPTSRKVSIPFDRFFRRPRVTTYLLSSERPLSVKRPLPKGRV